MRTVGLLRNTKGRSLIFVISEPGMVERLKEERVVFTWKKVEKGGDFFFLLVGCCLSPRGNNLKLEMRLICGRSSTVNQLQIKEEIKQLNRIILQLGKRNV